MNYFLFVSKSIQKGCDSPLSYPLPFHRSANSAVDTAICFSDFILSTGYYVFKILFCKFSNYLLDMI